MVEIVIRKEKKFQRNFSFIDFSAAIAQTTLLGQTFLVPTDDLISAISKTVHNTTLSPTAGQENITYLAANHNSSYHRAL